MELTVRVKDLVKDTGVIQQLASELRECLLYQFSSLGWQLWCSPSRRLLWLVAISSNTFKSFSSYTKPLQSVLCGTWLDVCQLKPFSTFAKWLSLEWLPGYSVDLIYWQNMQDTPLPQPNHLPSPGSYSSRPPSWNILSHIQLRFWTISQPSYLTSQ